MGAIDKFVKLQHSIFFRK